MSQLISGLYDVVYYQWETSTWNYGFVVSSLSTNPCMTRMHFHKHNLLWDLYLIDFTIMASIQWVVHCIHNSLIGSSLFVSMRSRSIECLTNSQDTLAPFGAKTILTILSSHFRVYPNLSRCCFTRVCVVCIQRRLHGLGITYNSRGHSMERTIDLETYIELPIYQAISIRTFSWFVNDGHGAYRVLVLSMDSPLIAGYQWGQLMTLHTPELTFEYERKYLLLMRRSA